VLAARVLKIFSPVSGSILIDIVCSPLFEYLYGAISLNHSYGEPWVVRNCRASASVFLISFEPLVPRTSTARAPGVLPYRVSNIQRGATAKCGVSEETVDSRRTDTRGWSAMMLSDEDYQETGRHYKNMKVNGHERQQYHALIGSPLKIAP
jgi:hypothetical protein